MSLREWFRPPRRLLALFIAVFVLPALALAWLAWRSLEQDRALERQRVQERLESVATTVVAGLQSRLDELSREVPALASSSNLTFPEDSVLLTIRDGKITDHPFGRILYYPYISKGKLPPHGALDAAEALEFRSQDFGGAADAFRRLSHSSDPVVRAASLLGLARCLRKSGRSQEALAAYDELARLRSLAVEDSPAELVARHARCALLAELKDSGLNQNATELYRDLQHRRWILDRASYEFYSGEARAWLPPDAAIAPSPAALALADAVGEIELLGQQQNGQPGQGRKTAWLHNRPVLIVWNNAPEQMTALVAGPAWLERWSALWKNQNVALALSDAESHTVLGPPEMLSRPLVVRQPAETGLPWTLRIASADSAKEFALLSSQRKVVLSGLAFIGILILVGGYLVARALSRELAVARLQTDFVAAVSHEFRSPLTSMKHLLEMLAQGAVTSEDRRQRYYEVLGRETDRLHRLVENLLNFRRMEAGVAEYHFEPLNAHALVASVAAEFGSRLASRERLSVSMEGQGVHVSGDREALARALWNLLDNAAKYSPDSTPIHLELAADDKSVSIRVRDQGAGIPSAEQKEIFKKFYRGAGTRKSGVKGTGIGLATVQYIIRAHRGEISLDSKPGDGSTFTIVLPLFRAAHEMPRSGTQFK